MRLSKILRSYDAVEVVSPLLNSSHGFGQIHNLNKVSRNVPKQTIATKTPSSPSPAPPIDPKAARSLQIVSSFDSSPDLQFLKLATHPSTGRDTTIILCCFSSLYEIVVKGLKGEKTLPSHYQQKDSANLRQEVV